MSQFKRNLIFILFFVKIFSCALAQTSTQNYIQTFDVQVPNITQASTLIISTPASTAVQTIQYFDGLGRPAQTVQKAITPEGYDMVKPFTYNFAGFDVINYEPYAVISTSTGNFQTETEVASAQPAFYSQRFTYNGGGDANGKSPTEYENSPLNRVFRQGAPGDDWQLDPNDHPISFSYLSNSGSNTKLNAILWKASGNTCTKAGNYADNQLFVTLTTGEDGAETYEFKDKQGQVVLKRSVLDASINADTYYVYDDFGLLRFVISPEGSKQITASSFTPTDPIAKQYIYCYTYDERKRLIEKQIPGKEPEYYVYDKTDKVILYQDGNMRKERVANLFDWMFTKYDALGRVITSGIIGLSKTSSRQTLQSEANTASYPCWEYISYIGTVRDGNNNYYSNLAYPVLSGGSEKIVYTLNYYDKYNVWLGTTSTPVLSEAKLAYSALPVSYQPELGFVTAKPTVGFVYCNGIMLASASYYDIYGRVIQTRSQNHIANGFDYNTNQYNGITANISKTVHEQVTAFISGTLKEESNYTYDPAGRPLTYTYLYGTGSIRTFTFTYNTLGKLISKQIQDAAAPVLQTVDYTYNIRGWLTTINNPATVSSTGDLFGMELLYNIPNSSLSNTPLYNGNISGTVWQTAQPTGISTPVTTGIKAYKYSYDKLNRLLQGVFTENWVVTNKYSEFTDVSAFVSGAIPYDLNGNIKYMRRYGLRTPNTYTTIDELTYTYDGNKLIGVDDVVVPDNGGDFWENGKKYTGTPEYTYDNNGNLYSDLNKGILSIAYNSLNLPVSINKTVGNRVEYIYDAAGNKRRQLYYVNGTIYKTTDFVGNFVYENNVPAYVAYPEGRVVLNSTGTAYCNEAYIKDHLGNVRVACYNVGSVIKTRQVNSYYPFGMNIKELSANSTDTYKPNEYLYNGKMMQDEMGLGWLDYGARSYDPMLGRFQVPDRYGEKYLSLSNYQYGANNPIRFIDVNGDSIVYKNESTKTYIEQFTSETITNKKGTVVKNKQYNELFAKIIEKLEASSTVYEFSDSYNSSNTTENGKVSTDGKKVYVEFGKADEEYGSQSNLLFEETYHALQIETGFMKIEKSSSNSTSYVFTGDALNSEYQAKQFSASAPGSTLSYKNADGLQLETQIGLIISLDPAEGKRYLTDGCSKTYFGDNNSRYTIDYNGPYPDLKK